MKVRLKSILQGWLIHFAIVLLIVNLAFIIRYIDDLPTVRMTPWQYFIRHTFQKPDALGVLISLLFIEINYQVLFKKIRLPFFILTCLPVGVLCFVALQYLDFGKQERSSRPLDPVLYVAGYAFLYAIARNYLYNIRHKTDVQLLKFKNELDALKAHINPHFLFNSLNYLYGTALAEKAANTADGIDQLSEMMRYTITGIHENFVPVEKELRFIGRYLELQQARLPESDSIKIDTEFPSAVPALQIAPLLLLPFIENAFKYGISMDEPCFVSIKISIAGTQLSLAVSNSVTRVPIEIKGNNTGIKNTIKRLKLMYAGKFNLEQSKNENVHHTQLILTLKP